MSEELAIIESQPSAQLAPTDNPAGFLKGYVGIADELSKVIRDKSLTSKISGRDYVRVEGWTMLGSMLGVFPVTLWTRRVDDADGRPLGWEARVEARTRDGAVIGAAEAECLRTETTWKSRDDYAIRSMAQTRATSKAMRQPLGFVMTLAGFEATPAEEMPAGSAPKASAKQIEFLRSLLKKANYSTSHIGDKPLEELSREEASSYIEQLKSGAPIDESPAIEGEYIDEDDIPF